MVTAVIRKLNDTLLHSYKWSTVVILRNCYYDCFMWEFCLYNEVELQCTVKWKVTSSFTRINKMQKIVQITSRREFVSTMDATRSPTLPHERSKQEVSQVCQMTCARKAKHTTVPFNCQRGLINNETMVLHIFWTQLTSMEELQLTH